VRSLDSLLFKNKLEKFIPKKEEFVAGSPETETAKRVYHPGE
jgi:hypothetical protein